MWSYSWLFVLEAVIITAANVATIIIFTRTRRLHCKQYIMIISQAVADLFVGLVSVPVFTVYILSKDTHSLFEIVYQLIDCFFGAASLFGLAALAIERAHATYFPFRHSKLGNSPYVIGIILMWLVPFLVVGLYFLFTESPVPINIRTTFIGVILVIISAAYILIVLKVRCSTYQAHDVNVQENKKLTVTLAVVTILSLAMWLPYPCIFLASKRASSYIYFSAKFLHYGNSLVNSVVYAFRMREIKREIFRLIRCCRSNQVSGI